MARAVETEVNRGLKKRRLTDEEAKGVGMPKASEVERVKSRSHTVGRGVERVS